LIVPPTGVAGTLLPSPPPELCVADFADRLTVPFEGGTSNYVVARGAAPTAFPGASDLPDEPTGATAALAALYCVLVGATVVPHAARVPTAKTSAVSRSAMSGGISEVSSSRHPVASG
jgi:hypothetical protein